MVTVPAGSTLTLRCPGEEPLALITLVQVTADFVSGLPPIPVLGPDGPGTRRFGILELVSSAGVTWIEAELRDGLVGITGEHVTDVVQRRGAPRWPGAYAAVGTAQVDGGLLRVEGQVEDVSTTGLLLRGSPHLPAGIDRTLLHVAMPWGEMTAAVATVEQRGDQLRGTYETIDPADVAELGRL